MLDLCCGKAYPEFERTSPTGDELEGSWFGKPGDPITEDFMPGGNG